VDVPRPRADRRHRLAYRPIAGAVSAIAANRLLFWGLMIAQLGIVFVLSARAERLGASAAAGKQMGQKSAKVGRRTGHGSHRG